MDRTLGLQLSGTLVERLRFSLRAAAVEFREVTDTYYKVNALLCLLKKYIET